jgi:hypothetical protein
LPPDLSSSL